MGSYTPHYTESDFQRVLRREFAGEAEEANALLQQYGSETNHAGPLRVRMACLKLANGNLGQLQRYVQAACGDPRDVLAWAEYRNMWRAKGSEALARAAKLDWQELQEWLKQ